MDISNKDSPRLTNAEKKVVVIAHTMIDSSATIFLCFYGTLIYKTV